MGIRDEIGKKCRLIQSNYKFLTIPTTRVHNLKTICQFFNKIKILRNNQRAFFLLDASLDLRPCLKKLQFFFKLKYTVFNSSTVHCLFDISCCLQFRRV